MAGFFKINRQIEQHWIWNSSEAFDKRSAWIELIMNANWTDKKWTPNSKETILIKRGSFATSEIKLADKWKWDRGKVRRFLKRLEDDNMIKKIATKNYIIIEIINYSSYQDKEEKCYNERTTNDTINDTTSDTTETIDISKFSNTDTTTNETTDSATNAKKANTTKEIRNKNKDIHIVQSEELWKLYPNKTGKGKVITKIPNLIKEYGFEQMKNTITRYVEYVEHRKNTDFKNLKYQNGSTFFNSGYIDYLDENFTSLEAKNKPWWADVES